MNVALLTVFSRVFLGYSSSLLPWQSHLSSRLVAVSPLLSSQSASVSCHLQNFSLFLKRGCKRTWSVSGLIYDRYGLSWAFLALVCRSPFTLTLPKDLSELLGATVVKVFVKYTGHTSSPSLLQHVVFAVSWPPRWSAVGCSWTHCQPGKLFLSLTSGTCSSRYNADTSLAE